MALEGRYSFAEAEPRLQQAWAEQRIYHFTAHTALPLYTIDTPPPTISGQIHIGHVYSYTQADVIARYQRMRGRMVFYPFGFDDNGLPTERFTEQSRGITAQSAGREPFIRACLELSAEMEQRFERFWRRLGLSVDWRLRYSTIDDRARRVAQRSFIDLFRQGKVERREAPTLWCPQCKTSVAQADVDDRDGVPTAFVTLPFCADDGRILPVATTRPELLPACGAVFVHPDDARYSALIGSRVRVPLSDVVVPVLANREAQPEKGTGAVMCCTFGDVSDVRWWYQYELPLRIALRPDGTMNDLAGPYQGLTIAQARERVIGDLQQRGLLLQNTPITHTIGVHERCGTPVEYLVSRQWFIGVIALRERLLEAGRTVRWHPEHMRVRYDHWVSGLSWDWNISRQRTYGVPFPLWYCRHCGAVHLASEDALPIDPADSQPSQPCASCGGTAFEADPDVLDTWATSSLTPEICASLAAEHGISAEDFLARPMDLRPNAHDIIRTWDFYTLVRTVLRGGQIPWRDVMISGHAVNQEGLKLSKSKLSGAADPTSIIEQYSADAVRYWTAGVQTGSDTAVSEDAFRQGGKLVTKLWNAARFVLQAEPQDDEVLSSTVPPRAVVPSDRWILARLGATIAQVTAAMEQFEPSAARAAIERFFWSEYCGTYLELVKYRLGRRALEDGTATYEHERAAAITTLRWVLRETLVMFAPIMPFVTDEIFGRAFASDDTAASIHRSGWPQASAYSGFEEALALDRVLSEIIDQVRRYKAAHNLSVGAPLRLLTVRCPEAYLTLLAAMRLDLACITRATALDLQAGTGDQVIVVPEHSPA